MAHPQRVRWIEETLRDGLQPAHLVVEDESDRHVGHPGAGGGGHFRVLIVAEAFRGQSLLERQRAVYRVLGDAMHTTIHALGLRTLTPDEWQRAGQADPAR